MENRDLVILNHIAQYRVSMPAVIKGLCFKAQPDAYSPVMDRLRNREKVLQSHRVLRGGRSYHQLTRKGASLLGLPESYARPLGRKSVIQHLSILWFCTMGTRLRNYLKDPKDLADLFAGEVPPGEHCLELEGDQYRLYQIYVPEEGMSRKNLFKAVRERHERTSALSAVNSWIETRKYAFAILVTTETRKDVMMRFVRGRLHAEQQNDIPLAAMAHYWVECVPDFENALR